MDALVSRHTKELRDLQSRIAQKKKNASKKTRKGVTDECNRLEGELQDRHARELAELNGDPTPSETADVAEEDILDNNTPTEPNTTQPPSQNGVYKSDLATDPTASLTSSLANTTLDPNPPSTSEPQPRKRNRQKERLARRAAERDEVAAQAAEEAASMPDLREKERTAMLAETRRRGLVEREVRADGHCLYAAVADQLGERGLRPKIEVAVVNDGEEGKGGYKVVREVAGEYIESHKEDFEAFLEEPLVDYVRKVKETGEWGGHLELMALARAYGVTIHVVQGNGRVESIESGRQKENGAEKDDIWLAYYRHGFGLGEHYNSLRKSEG
ncbi:cysteine proteinase [Eremomyces bilateralis CBS 781.70]|uniref:Cysteine proteinase n=1 Tax=Eremomyces bilateralis CBS 781.70 TaxID=1392243 RepID=A0A6G1G5Z2_9PEZI|nr:cysteine proteinase [Eremomyces bilateralis CBS 781.70]KAF1813464.1 cysteine proteinase [Eremomyces bilateralis CBS 781.70]